VGCICAECRDRQAVLDGLIRKHDQRQEVAEARRAEADVPIEDRIRAEAESAHVVATIEAEDLGRIRDRLREGIGYATKRAERVAVLYRGRRKFKSEDATEFFSATQRAAELYERDQRLGKMQKRAEKRAEQARVVAERSPYSKDSPHSWISDCLAARDTSGEMRSYEPGWDERLQRHGAVVAQAVGERSKYGRQILASYGEGFRSQNVEQNRKTVEKQERDLVGLFRETRGLTTGGGATVSASGGGVAAYVTPQFLLDQFAVYRSPCRVVADQLNGSLSLPSYGLSVYVPQITSAVSVGTTTEDGATAEADPTVAYVSGAVTQKSGQLTLSQAVLDRTGPGISADVWIMAQLKDALGAQIDVVAITALLANANAITNAGAFALTASGVGVGGTMGDLKKAKSKTTDTAGTRIRSTHLFTTSDFADYIESYSDGQSRPVFSPAYDDNQLPLKAVGDPDGEGCTGYNIAGLFHFADDNIPNSGSDTQLIVTRPSYTLLLEGAPVTALFPQYGAGNLDPVISIRSYVACVPRYPAAVSAISGAAYTATTFQ